MPKRDEPIPNAVYVGVNERNCDADAATWVSKEPAMTTSSKCATNATLVSRVTLNLSKLEDMANRDTDINRKGGRQSLSQEK